MKTTEISDEIAKLYQENMTPINLRKRATFIPAFQLNSCTFRENTFNPLTPPGSTRLPWTLSGFGAIYRYFHGVIKISQFIKTIFFTLLQCVALKHTVMFKRHFNLTLHSDALVNILFVFHSAV